MKFIFTLFILLATATAAQADSINFQLGDQTNSNGTSSNVYTIKYIHDVNKNLDVGVMINNSRNTSTEGVVSLYEISTRYKIPVVNKTAIYIGPTLGSLQPSGVDSKNYLGLEFGAMTKITDRIGLRADYTKMTGINVDTMDNTYSRIWASYDLTKKNTIGIRRDFMRGDLEFDTWSLMFQHRF